MLMIIHRQNKEHIALEIIFEGVERFSVIPTREGYDSVIFTFTNETKRWTYFFC